MTTVVFDFKRYQWTRAVENQRTDVILTICELNNSIVQLKSAIASPDLLDSIQIGEGSPEEKLVVLETKMAQSYNLIEILERHIVELNPHWKKPK